MYAVKKETEVLLCRGCLSTDRKLSPLTDYDLYCTLVGVQHSPGEYKYLNVLCWECQALLRRTQAFSRRLRKAARTLTLSHKEIYAQTFSTLKVTHKQNYDCVIEETVESKPQDFTYNINVKEELPDTFEMDNYSENFDNEIKEEEKEVKSEKRKYNKQRESRSARKVENTIDMNDPDKYFAKTSLSEMEVEEILKKERDGDTEFRRYQCQSCRFRFFSRTDLYNHRKSSHKKRSTTGKCKHCTFTFRTQWDLQLHWWRSHPVNRCSLCEQVVLDKDKRQHLERHRFKYRCESCGEEFDNRQLYYYHDKQLHSKYICDHCGRSNATKTSLLKHITRHHLPNKCASCGLVCASHERLARHTRARHAPRDGERAYCVECDASFPTPDKYRRHLTTSRKHRPPKKISVPCPECGKVFSRKAYMNNHIRLFHSNESRHHCQLCNKYFVTGFSLRCHIKYVHMKIPMPKNKICNVCGRGFATNRVLANHMRTHTGERPFACAHCAAAFAQRVALRAHVAAKHKEKIPRDGAPVAS